MIAFVKVNYYRLASLCFTRSLPSLIKRLCGSINLLSFGTAEESMMRLVSGNVAFELGRTVEAK
jgi:hypothetical protein